MFTPSNITEKCFCQVRMRLTLVEGTFTHAIFWDDFHNFLQSIENRSGECLLQSWVQQIQIILLQANLFKLIIFFDFLKK